MLTDGVKCSRKGDLMLKVIKRNGDTAEFDLKRISDAIMKAFVATDVQYTNDIVDLLSMSM